MMLCPHCQTPVDETAVTNCPACFLPLKFSPTATAVDDTPQTPALAAAPTALPAAAPEAPVPPTASSVEAAIPPSVPVPVVPPVPLRASAGADAPSPLDAPQVTPAPAALPAPPPAALPLGGAGGSTVMSLTGEILQKPAQTMPSMGPGARPGSRSPLPGSARPAPMRASAARSGSGGVAAVLLTLLVLGGGGFGGWYWWTHRSDPRKVVTLYLTAAADEDYATLYEITDLNAQDLAHYPDAKAYEKNAKQQKKRILGGLKALEGNMFGTYIDKGIEAGKTMLKQAKVGEAKVDGDTATVPVTMHFSMAGIVDKDVHQDVQLKYVSGGWKVEKGAAPGLQSAFRQ